MPPKDSAVSRDRKISARDFEMFCAFCGAGHGVLGDTGGTGQSLTSDEAVLLDSLAITTRGSYGAARLRLRRVAKAEFTPLQALALAEAAADTYPSGVVVIHLARKCAYVFTGGAQRIHLGCAVSLLRLRLSVGVVVGRGKVYALQVGKRVAPLLKLLG